MNDNKRNMYVLLLILLSCVMTGCSAKQPSSTVSESSTEIQTQPETITEVQTQSETLTEVQSQSDTETEETKPSGGIEDPIQVSYAGEEPSEYRDLEYDTIVLEESEYQVQIVFTAQQSVRDFRIYRLSFNDIDSEGNPVFETEQIYEQDELSHERPLKVVLTFPGDMPTVGFSYVRQDGQECRFSMVQSGKDGSLITSPIK